ncbi:6-pyruvoyl trahydropterin synthase family protein [Streptomyces asiaticus]
MTLRITKRFEFSASHQLSGLAEDHQCGRLHGHNYVVELELSAAQKNLTPTGFVRDFGDLSSFKSWLDRTVDHRHLNDIINVSPTAENLAIWLYDQCLRDFPELTAVRISETPKTWAEYRPDVA